MASRDDIKMARLAGFKAKKPKKPPIKGRTLARSDDYVGRCTQWEKDVKSAAVIGRKMDKI